MNVNEQLAALTYKFKRPDGVDVTTILEGGKTSIMEERNEAGGIALAILERSQLTVK